jgi:hypothetical protein
MQRRYWKTFAALSYGAITLGWLQAWELVNFSSIWTNFITMLLSALVTILFGGDAGQLFA